MNLRSLVFLKSSSALMLSVALLMPHSMQASPASDALREATRAQWAEDWHKARLTVRGIGRDIVEWHYLRAGEGSWREYKDFINRNSDWPGLPLLMRRGEEALAKSASNKDIIDYLTLYPAKTGAGAIALIGAFEQGRKRIQAQNQAIEAWRDIALSQEEQEWLMSRYGASLKAYHVERVNNLLWRQDFEQARQMQDFLPQGWRELIQALDTLWNNKEGVDTAIAAVPAHLSSNPLLQHARFDWRMRKGRHDQSAELIAEVSRDVAHLGQPEAWGNRRRALARQMMRNKNYQLAYDIAAHHGLKSGDPHYSDLEWLAGYISLRFLNRTGNALDHFNSFRISVASPISLGRAAYWEGRALEELGAHEDAKSAYSFGARFQSSFYGQLSAEKLGLNLDQALVKPSKVEKDISAFDASSVLEAAVLLHEAGQLQLSARFLRHLGEVLTDEELIQLTHFAHDLDPYLAVLVAKAAAARGVIVPDAYFPLHEMASADLPVAPELALAIARRESEFNPKARSGVGARGLMQLMPRTGAAMADKLSVTTFQEADLDNPVLNARLGSAYLEQLIEEFGNNVPLVASGYNAGPSRARAWIERYGDPRAGQVDVIDWIEHIPFRETRNYVMRVMESVLVYRGRLSDGPVAINLTRELSDR